MSEQTKTCTKCGEVKALDAFGRRGKGFRSACRTCERIAGNARMKEKYKANREMICARRRELRKANPEKARAYRKAWNKSHREQELIRRAAWRDANREGLRAKANASRKANPGRKNEQQAAWCKANPEKVKAINRKQLYELTPSVVARSLGIPTSDCPPELIDLKREQLQIRRLTKQLNQAIKDAQK